MRMIVESRLGSIDRTRTRKGGGVFQIKTKKFGFVQRWN